MAMTALECRTRDRLKQNETDSAAQQDVRRLKLARKQLEVTRTLHKLDMDNEWQEENMKRRQRASQLTSGRIVPALDIQNPTIRRAAIQWYYGWFPIWPLDTREAIRRRWREHTRTLGVCLTKPKLSKNDIDRTTAAIRSVKK